MSLLESRRITVTGGANGSGQATSALAAEKAASVVAVDLVNDVHETIALITRRAGQPCEIAEMTRSLLSDRASCVNGQATPVDGGLSSSHPWIFPR